tara:strand:- start:67 stop:240 length:174 start_codon:yes stop_codon:yes gene_type:complete
MLRSAGGGEASGKLNGGEEAANSMVASKLQLLNAQSPIEVRLAGNSMAARDRQPADA